MNILNRLQKIDGNLPKEVGGLRCVTALTDQQELAVKKSDSRGPIPGTWISPGTLIRKAA